MVDRNGFTYISTAAGTSGSNEPVWPVTDGQTVQDGTVTWTASTSLCTVNTGLTASDFVISAGSNRQKKADNSSQNRNDCPHNRHQSSRCYQQGHKNPAHGDNNPRAGCDSRQSGQYSRFCRRIWGSGLMSYTPPSGDAAVFCFCGIIRRLPEIPPILSCGRNHH